MYSIILILIIYCIFNNFSKKKIFKNFIISILLTLLLSFSKINYSLSFLELFPREIKGATLDNYFSLIYTFFTSMFIIPDPFFFDDHQFNLKKSYIYLHELEYGLSILPLLIVFYYIFFIKKKLDLNKNSVYLLIFLLFLPTMLMVQIPYLSNIINELPVVSSTWVRVRWLSVYILPVILISCFLLNRIKINRKTIMIILFAIPICQNYFYIEAKGYFFPEKSFKIKQYIQSRKLMSFQTI